MSTLDDAKENAAVLARVWTAEVARLMPPPILPDEVVPNADDEAIFERIDDVGLALERLTALHEAYVKLLDTITIAAREARKDDY